MTALPLSLLPETAIVGANGVLSIGGCDTLDLADEYGTPLFVYDETHLRMRCREAVAAFRRWCGLRDQGLPLSGDGEAGARGGHAPRCSRRQESFTSPSRRGVPADRLVLHGNNKSAAELAMALDRKVGRIVVDSFDELDRLDRLVTGDRQPPPVLLRVTPGIEAHTHEYVQTGQVDSKFGFGLAAGDAAAPRPGPNVATTVDLVGVHVHIGSQVFEAEFFHRAVGALAPMVNNWGLPELSIGGGLGVAYTDGEEAPTITEWGAEVRSACVEAGITARVSAEPGRAIAAAAAVTLYRVGTVKDIPDVRTYVSVDGGMSDNPRPVLYGSGYEAFLPGLPWSIGRDWSPSSASTASPVTCLSATPRFPPISRSVTSLPHRSLVRTATRWAPTTTRYSDPPWCSSPTATPASS